MKKLRLRQAAAFAAVVAAFISSITGCRIGPSRAALNPQQPTLKPSSLTVTVKLQGTDYVGRAITLQVSEKTYTSADGRFHISGLGPGQYTVTASAPPFYLSSTPVQVSIGDQSVAVDIGPLPIAPSILSSNSKGTMYVPTVRGYWEERDVLDIMARLVAAEARGEPYVGQAAVAAVIVNRVEAPETYFSNTIADVLLQPVAENSPYYQFAPMADPMTFAPETLSEGEYQLARQATFEAIAGYDPTTTQALFFYAYDSDEILEDSWIAQKAKESDSEIIGNHLFFRPVLN